MSRNSRALFALFVVAGIGNGPREAEAAEPNPIVAIKTENPNGLASLILMKAQELASEIYEQAGVALRWATDERPANRSLTIVLTTVATAPPGVTPESMGIAPSSGDGSRGTTAYVFTDRVIAFASANRVAAEYVFACALAHEIGHLLLPPNAHDSIGIMRATWHPALFPPKAPGVPGFPPVQARLLRLRAGGR